LSALFISPEVLPYLSTKMVKGNTNDQTEEALNLLYITYLKEKGRQKSVVLLV
jgi:hypothetical protein